MNSAFTLWLPSEPAEVEPLGSHNGFYDLRLTIGGKWLACICHSIPGAFGIIGMRDSERNYVMHRKSA